MSYRKNVLTLEEKMHIVNVYDDRKLSVRALARLFQIGKTQAADIIKKKEEIRTRWHSVDQNRLFLKTVALNIDKVCYEWFMKATYKRIPISGPLLKAKARNVAEQMGYKSFSASDGWLNKFCTRHRLNSRGEALEQETVDPGDFMQFEMKVYENFPMPGKKILCLFDVDGTLTKPRNSIEDDLYNLLLTRLKQHCSIGLVGGSDLKKICEQMKGDDIIQKLDYVFAENGLISFKDGKQGESQTIQKFMGEDKLQKFINYVLKYLSGVTLPVKRGTFIEFRTGMLNISPIGRSCSQDERDDFEKYDKQHQIRKSMIENLRKEFPDIGLTYSIGGQISFDVFPDGWNKTYCLGHLEKEGFDEIHFFGDKTYEGGNDYEIFNDKRVVGHNVANPQDTKRQLEEFLKSL